MPALAMFQSSWGSVKWLGIGQKRVRAWKVQRWGWEGLRGVRQRRPSAKEKKHKEERSLERAVGRGRLQMMRFSFLGMRVGRRETL
jgi:hypothetical protein